MAARSFLSISTLDCSPTPVAMTQTRRSGTWSCSSSSSSPPVLGDAQGYWRQQEDELSLAHSGWRMSLAADSSIQCQPLDPLSSVFWPQFKAESLELPHEVNRSIGCSHQGFTNIEREHKLGLKASSWICKHWSWYWEQKDQPDSVSYPCSHHLQVPGGCCWVDSPEVGHQPQGAPLHLAQEDHLLAVLEGDSGVHTIHLQLGWGGRHEEGTWLGGHVWHHPQAGGRPGGQHHCQ